MKQIELLIYDLDGTLIDSVRDITEAVNLMLTELGLSPRKSEQIKTFIGEGIQNLVARSLGKENLHLAERALKILKKRYSEHLLDHTKLYPGVSETLEHFKSKKQAVLTNKPEVFSRKILEGLNVARYFQMIIGGDSIHTKKPSPEGVFQILNTLQITPDRTLLVGDSSIDVETARSASVLVCVVTYGLGKKDALLTSNPDFQIERLDELKKIFC